MGQKPILIAIGVTVVSLVVLGISMVAKAPRKISTSPYILYLTQPVNNISATVAAIDKNTITVSRSAQIIPGGSTATTPYPTGTLTYKVKITGKTQFHRDIIPADYTQKTHIPLKTNKTTIQDLKKGQMIDIFTDSDLRFVADNTFEATTIGLPPLQMLISGTVVKNQGDALIINPSTETGTYTIHLTGSTTVVKNTFLMEKGTVESEKTTPNSLQPGTLVLIYLEKVMSEPPLTAAYLEYTVYPSPAPSSLTPGAPLSVTPLPPP